MNDLDELIGSALRARAEQVTEADLSPAATPLEAPAARPAWAVPLLAAAAVAALAVGSTIAVRSLSASPSGHGRTGAATAPVNSPSAVWTLPSAPMSSSTNHGSGSQLPPSHPVASQPGSANGPFQLGYQPLWPFGDYRSASQWEASYRSQGSQPWHLDAGQTALDFTRSYLGFTELNLVTSARYDSLGAHVGVGYRNPSGQSMTSAILHLVRYGTSAQSPWEVVGSDDTTFSLELPAYGSTVRSPVTVGGQLTGVDESIRLAARSLTGGLVSAATPGIPAGGQQRPWHGRLSFQGSGVLTIVASIGGHLQAVERFAIQGVHT